MPENRRGRRRRSKSARATCDGHWRTLESVGQFQPDGAGGRFFIVHSRDVGARKLLEAQVRQAQKMEAVGLSTGAIAHDFNNMLVVIAGYTALLATDPSQTVREFAREMRMATDRATELTGQLLSFARASQIDEPSCDANEVIADFRPILDRMVGRDVHVSYALDAVAVAGAGRPQRARSGADQPGRQRARRHARRRRAHGDDHERVAPAPERSDRGAAAHRIRRDSASPTPVSA